MNFFPRTVRELVTSSAEPKDGPDEGRLTVSCERQMKQMAERRRCAAIEYSNQAVDDLVDTESSSVDVVVSFQAAQRMHENGYDWKKSIREAGRVLKPGGRFLFVESAEVAGESYLDEVIGLAEVAMENKQDSDSDDVAGIKVEVVTKVNEDGEVLDAEDAATAVFEEVGYDQVDMVLTPFIAGVAVKAMDADLTAAQKSEKDAQTESDRLAEISLNAFERGNKRRKRKKKKTNPGTGMGN